MPSVFGKNNLDFGEEADVHVEKNTDYFNRIAERIESKVGKDNKKRAVLVFFSSLDKLQEFYKS